jgi:hypothetical protein
MGQLNIVGGASAGRQAGCCSVCRVGGIGNACGVVGEFD